jgi:hypothetical protein
MDKISRQPEQAKINKNSRTLSFSEQNHRRNSQDTEHSRPQQRTDADLGKTSGTDHKTSKKVGSKSKDYSSSRPQGRSSQPMSSSRSRTLHIRQSWQQKNEISVTPNSAERSSKPSKDNRKLKGGASAFGYLGFSTNISNDHGVVIYGNKNTVDINEDTTEHQPAASDNTSGS